MPKKIQIFEIQNPKNTRLISVCKYAKSTPWDIGKLKIITWNWFDTDCKNEWAIFTRCISFTGPFSKWLLSVLNLLRLLPGVEAKINYSYAEALLFVWLKGCSSQVEVNSKKTKEYRISHLLENGSHSSDEGNPYVKTTLHTFHVLEKLLKTGNTNRLLSTHLFGV